MATITPVKALITGVNPAPVAASAGGDAVVNHSGKAMVRIINGGSSITVTIAPGANPTRAADGTFPAMTLAAQVITVPGSGASRVIGPIPPAYNDGNGLAQLTYSSVTSVTIDAIEP